MALFQDQSCCINTIYVDFLETYPLVFGTRPPRSLYLVHMPHLRSCSTFFFKKMVVFFSNFLLLSALCLLAPLQPFYFKIIKSRNPVRPSLSSVSSIYWILSLPFFSSHILSHIFGHTASFSRQVPLSLSSTLSIGCSTLLQFVH